MRPLLDRSEIGLPYHERQRLLQERQQQKQAPEGNGARNLTDAEMQRWDQFFRGHIEQRLTEEYERVREILEIMVADTRERIADAVEAGTAKLRAEFAGATEQFRAKLMAEVERKIAEQLGLLRADMTRRHITLTTSRAFYEAAAAALARASSADQKTPVRLSLGGCSFQFGRTWMWRPRAPHLAHTILLAKDGTSGRVPPPEPNRRFEVPGR
jgi:hypothetical protein